MPKIDESRLKKIANRSAAGAASSTETPYPTERAAAQKAVAAALAAHIEGIAPLKRELDKLRAQTALKSEAARKKLAADAVKRGRTRKPLIASMISQRVKAFEAMADAVAVPSAKRYLVNMPIEIVGSALNFDSFAAVPSNSWVKFRMDRRKTPNSQYASVIFRFVWENTTDKYVVINVNGYVLLHGHYDLWSDGGIFGGDRSTRLELRPTLQLFNWTTEPYLSLGKEEVLALDAHTDTGATWDDAQSNVGDVYRGYDLAKTLILVPPYTSVGLVTSLEIKYYAGKNSGIVQANFSDGAYLVGSPAVLVTVVS